MRNRHRHAVAAASRRIEEADPSIPGELIPYALVWLDPGITRIAKRFCSGRANFLRAAEGFDVSGLGGPRQLRPIHSAVEPAAPSVAFVAATESRQAYRHHAQAASARRAASVLAGKLEGEPPSGGRPLLSNILRRRRFESVHLR